MTKNINLIIFFLLVFVMTIFNTFTNTYIIIKNNYETRLINSFGDCSRTGYGFIKKVINKFPKINGNLTGYNFEDYPLATGFFWNPKLKYSDDYVLLINSKQDTYLEFLEKNYINIYQEDNCYLLKKND